jgi:hypothetical protein
MQFCKFIPIVKIDAAKREVYGIVTSEAVDKDGEICDYASTAPHYKAWSAEFEKATDGKSLGNVREMHANKAAGKVTALDFDDAAKEIRIGARIVDDEAWKKCEEGVYTGFSHGGSYVKVWNADGQKRYTAKPSEVSLVDNPCNPEAHFEYVKEDGAIEVRKFTGLKPGASENSEPGASENSEPGASEAAALPGSDKGSEAPSFSPGDVAKRDVSDKERARLAEQDKAMPDGGYPIANESDLRNAIQAFGRAKDPEAVRAHIIRRARELGCTNLLPADWSPQHAKIARAGDPDWPGSTRKNRVVGQSGNLAIPPQRVKTARAGDPVEKQDPGDALPPQLPNYQITQLPDEGGNMEKVGAKFSAETRATLDELQEHHQALVDLHGQMADHHEAIKKCFGKLFGQEDDKDGDTTGLKAGASEDGDGKAAKAVAPAPLACPEPAEGPAGPASATQGTPGGPAASQPAGGDAGATLTKLSTERDALQKRVTDLEAEVTKAEAALTRANTELTKLLAEPKPPKAAARAVPVTKDADAAGAAGPVKKAEGLEMLKAIHRGEIA